jgi:Na+/H+ antiporter NhaC
MESYGFLSVIPPITAIIVAIITRNVLVALFIGIFTGVTIIYDWNPILALPAMIKDYLFEQGADPYNSSSIILVIFVGGMVSLLTNSGGAVAFARKATRFINSKLKISIAIWVAGLAIWFSDFANALLIGPIFQPIADKLKISREKLAWIIDATSAPICALVPIAGFGIFSMVCIQKEFQAYGVEMSEWSAYVRAIPFQFYSIGTLLLVPIVSIIGYDFGSMSKAELRTANTGKMLWPDSKPIRLPISTEIPKGIEPKLSLIVYPLATILIVFFAYLMQHGFPYRVVPSVILRTGLTSAYFCGALVCFIMMVWNKIKTIKETLDLYIEGMKSNLFLCAILLLAWSLSAICRDMGTANFIVQLLGSTLPTWSIAPLLFITGGIISFATGTSYGTYAILLPIAIPMSIQLNAPLIPCLGAVFSGGIFGDQCSPISDTTVLASMGAACDLIDHVKTQLPYALIVALASIIIYTLASWIESSLILLILNLILILVILLICYKFFGHKTPKSAIVNLKQ